LRGSENYTPPEVLLNESVSSASDIWQVGLAVIEMLTGKVPFYHLTVD